MPDRHWRLQRLDVPESFAQTRGDHEINASRRAIVTSSKCEACFAFIRTRPPARPLDCSWLPLLRQIAQIIIAGDADGSWSINRLGHAGSPRARRHNLLHHGDEALLVRFAQIGHGFQMGQPC